MNQGGKNAAAEPGRPENKRERRRGAAGRAAALRRAPSDSDCSGETASLSADSGDRAPRPAPLAPPRSGKTRSRRRGSEWEVLEGLKDGQRFEKRPDVFNGYLHKKRKWPLKGWHKRFFVVDGGILVYARSPTDVARGRLHGSVDVGLSVISAKARRRRIDIDADEFIYHLRAKTPEVFRTWLNVLKAHRLYRQHLLTFGARESAPKIHPPLEDLPPTDNSSHASFTSDNSDTEMSEDDRSPVSSPPIYDETPRPMYDNSPPTINGDSPRPVSPLKIESTVYNDKGQSSIFKWQFDPTSISSLIPLNFDSLTDPPDLNFDENMFDLKFDEKVYQKSMCSMKCVAKKCTQNFDKNKSPVSTNTTDAEKQMTCTDLNLNSPIEENIAPLVDRKTNDCYVNNNNTNDLKENVNCTYHKEIPARRSPFLNKNKRSTTTACFFFTRKKNHTEFSNTLMKKSKKCTNLVKYKNVADEPPLRAQTSKCMLLGKYKVPIRDSDEIIMKKKPPMKASDLDDKTKKPIKTKDSDEQPKKPPVKIKDFDEKTRNSLMEFSAMDAKFKAIGCNVDCVHKQSNEVQVMTVKLNKGIQKTAIPDDYDKITEQLMMNIFRRCGGETEEDVKFYIEQVVQDLYDIKLNHDMHPVKALFRNLLEYWLKNTAVTRFKEAMTTDQYVNQSRNIFTKDANLSSYLIKMKSKETQCRGVNEVVTCKHHKIEGGTATYKYKIDDGTATINSTIKQRVKEIQYETKCHSPIPKSHSPQRDTASFEKERRIQELERLLKSTVYMCEMGCNNINKEKDIEITKKLINNIGHSTSQMHTDSDEKPGVEKGSSSAELPEIQETINHLISDTAISPDVAKEFLGAYLDVLMQDSAKSTNSSQSSDWNKDSKEIPMCEVVGEAVIKKVSKSITTLSVLDKAPIANIPNPDPIKNAEKPIDPGQMYLKDILDKVTTIFSKVTNMNDNNLLQNKPKEDTSPMNDDGLKTIKDELGRPVIKSKYDLIYENYDQNSLVIDLSRYNLEHISMFNDPALKDMMSITIKLKEKAPNRGETKPTRLSFKFPDDTNPLRIASVQKCENWAPLSGHYKSSNNIYKTKDSNNVACNYETKVHNVEHKPYFSTISEGTSKARRFFRDDSCNSSDMRVTAQTNISKDLLLEKTNNEEHQPCYLMSIKKGALASKFHTNKPLTKQCNCDDATSENQCPNKSTDVDKTDELSVFEKPAPKIIDEKFILLLLENLAYISRSVSSMHKDINTLYVKLKKKYEKFSKTAFNIQGLSLLGKIYSEDTCYKDGEDKGTQYELGACEDLKREIKHASTNTNISRIGERSACICTYTAITTNTAIQTEDMDILAQNTLTGISGSDFSFSFKHSEKQKMAVNETNTVDINTTEQSTSNPNCLKALTRDTAINTIVRYVFKESTPRPSSFKPTRPFTFERESLKKTSARVREELIKEITLLVPMIKVSTQSQTDRHVLRLALEKREKDLKDYQIYQLYLSKKCGMKTSSSLTCSSMDVEISDEIKTLYRCSSDPSNCSGLLSPTTPTLRGPQAGFVTGTPGGRFQGWIVESGGPLESAARELGQAQLSVQQLQRLLDALELQHQTHHDTDVSLEGASPNVKKDRRKFGLRKKKSNSKCASVDLQPPHIDPSASHTALSSLSALTAPPSPGGGACSVSNSAASLPIACAAARPQSLPGAETLNTAQGPASITSLTPDHQLREDFTVLAKDLVASLKGVVSSLACERGRLRAAIEAADAAATPGGAVMAALRTNLTSALQQNSELRTRLSRIHDASDIAEIMSVANSETVTRQFQQSLSYSSSCVSASEFFDAEEHEDDDLKPDDVIATDEAGVIELDGDSSSEAGSLSSEEGSASSDNSDGAMLSAEQVSLRHASNGPRPASCWTRRTRLPAPRPSPGGPSLWNLLYKNIGKDLSQISMPVTINEPLNMLQRLCEELEYSELLDSAAACGSAIERAALVAAFAVSAYAASAHRAASKPFNPLLAETYECIRDDRGFRFLAEQVSHHPPISACHAESPRWCFWQEARIKTKFWGKSMEFQPTGRVHVRLNTTGDHYTWNKVTTCVHNLFGGQRWVDQYGDMHIVCVGTDISCKLNFVKASSWSHTRHEVRGAVTEASTGARLRLAGRWSEALYAGEPPAARCLWRPGAMPPEHELYYGFTRFAMELNEIEPGMRELLPHTDTRLRPDQRALEEGDIEAAESYKHSLEQAQRERRRESPTHKPAWFRKTIEEGEETWVFSGEYWKAREAGFSEDVAPRIW